MSPPPAFRIGADTHGLCANAAIRVTHKHTVHGNRSSGRRPLVGCSQRRWARVSRVVRRAAARHWRRTASHRSPTGPGGSRARSGAGACRAGRGGQAAGRPMLLADLLLHLRAGGAAQPLGVAPDPFEPPDRAALRELPWPARSHVVAVTQGIPASVVAVWSQFGGPGSASDLFIGPLSCSDGGAPRGIRTPTARSVAWCSPSTRYS
jgi:hypothetical protein